MIHKNFEEVVVERLAVNPRGGRRTKFTHYLAKQQVNTPGRGRHTK